MLIYAEGILACILCIIAAFTDISHKKIYNKTIIIALIVSSIIYIIFYNEIKQDWVFNHLINCIITFIISILFYYLRIWAAGDAKLFWALSYILPVSLHEGNKLNLFPMIYLLIVIFSIAFIYVVIETIVLLIKDKGKMEKEGVENFSKLSIGDFILRYLANCSFITFLNNVIYKMFKRVAEINAPLIFISDMLIIMIIYKKMYTRKKFIILLGITIILNIIYYFIFGLSISNINIDMILLIIILMLFQNTSEKYNYEEIEVNNLKPGMILSAETVILFLNSKVKGLPTNTSEWTSARITKEEVESIKRWSKTKKGKNEIITVKYMPFAPFICIGTIIYLCIRIIL